MWAGTITKCRAGACITRLPAQAALLLIVFAEVSTGHPRAPPYGATIILNFQFSIFHSSLFILYFSFFIFH